MATAQEKKKKVGQTTLFHCNVTIRGIAMNSINVKSLVMRENVLELLPKLQLTIVDAGLFFEQYPLEDNDEILIEISKDSEKEAPITALTFSLQDHEVENMDRERINSVMIHITAILKAPDIFFPIHNRSFTKLSSVDVIKKLLEESKFEVDDKISTSDLMSWLQLNIANYDMIKDTIDHSFLDDDAIFCYLDRDGKATITSLKTELKKDDILPTNYDIRKSINDKQDNAGNDVRGADDAKKELFYNGFKFQNLSGYVNKTMGYGIQFNSYALDGQETLDIIDSDNHKLTDLSLKKKDNVGKLVKHFQVGMKFGEDQMHDNFLNAPLQNSYLKQTFFSSPLSIYINATNNVKLFDKLMFNIPSMTLKDGSDVVELNETYSGEYLVGGIIHQVGQGGQYKMIVNCYRDGQNKNNYVEDSEYRLNDV